MRRRPPSSRWPTSARPRGAPRTSARPTACATSCATWAGRCATARKDRSSSRPESVIYGRNPVREALRGRRRVRHIWSTSDEWRGATKATNEEIAARCGSDAHQGVCAAVDPYPYADEAELLAGPDPLIVALDEVTDPQNLGAICRTAEAAGATGVVIP